MDPQESPQQTPNQNPGVWQDIITRLKQGERETIIATVAFVVALLHSLIGASGGAIFTSLFLLNLALIGWIGNTAYTRRKNKEGNGLALLSGCAFALAALSVFTLASGLSEMLTGLNVLVDMGY